VVLYECLCGQKPFVAETLPHLAVLIAEGRYEAASLRRPGLGSECDAVIGRAMVADRNLRYPSVAALKTALEALRTGAPIEATATLPFAGTIPVDFPTGAPRAPGPTAAPRGTTGSALPTGAPAQTDAPLSHTRPEGRARGRGGLVAVALGLLVLGGVGVL